MNKFATLRCLAVCALAAHLTPALAGEEDHLGRVQSPIISNVLVSEKEQESLGLLQMTARTRGCSASLLTNSWAIAASHCLDGMDARSPNNVQLNGNWGANAQIGNADYIYRSWGLDYPGVMYDFVLLHLQRPMRVNGSLTGYVREFSELSLNDMMNVNVAVYGRGMNVLAVKDDKGNFTPSSGDNNFRSFVFTVNRQEPNLFWYPKGPNGEMVGGGDSGGPSFEVTRGVPRIAGVHAACHTDCLAGRSCPASDPWTWVSNIRECGDAPVGAIGGALYQIMKQTWDPARPIQTVQVAHSEGQVRKEMLLGYIDSLPWDYVRRAAMMMCQNRGFDFGFLDGNAQPGVRYQARCLNGSVARWFDAGPAHMQSVNDRFPNIAQVGWAQGARAANDICHLTDANSVGGMFTGYEVFTSPSGGFADRRDGVFCFNKTNATWFDSTQGELNAQGTPIGDLNATNWAVAGRAATEYCRRKHYPAGGFFNGHQQADKRGVVCLGANSLVSDRVNVGDSYGAVRAEAATPGGKIAATTGVNRGALVTQAAGARTPPILQSTQPIPVPVLLPDLNALASRGAQLAMQDPLATELRNRTSEGAMRRGFDVGFGIWEANTAPGPGKQKVHDALSAAEQPGFDVAAAFALPRNKYAALAKVGAAIGNADPGLARARNAENDVFFWLGFDIASGIFGNPAAGAQGNTATGPGSLGIRNELNAAGQRGFNASTALHLSRKYR